MPVVMTARHPLILDNVTIALGGAPLISDLSVTVREGEVLTLMGPSGSGKSTLLAYVCGSADAAFALSGEIYLGSERLTRLPPERRRIAILFQDSLLFPHLTVGENLAFGAPAGLSKRERHRRVEEALAEAELAGMADRHPDTLSGGQQARVALMRALLSEPQALLLDEPFSRLDQPLRTRLRPFVFDHIRRRHLPTIMVTHDLEDANAAGGRVIDLTEDL